WEPVYGLSDTIYSQATCVNGQVVDTFGSDPSIFQYPAFMFTITKADLVLGSNGGMKYELEETFKGFDYLQSTCSNYVYQTDSYSDVINGAWSFTPATNSMVLVFEFDDTGVPDPEAYEYTVKKINSNKFYLYDAVDDGWLRFEK
ncbi:MAG TPA: hypothetical protein VFZ78_08635, partial [Flavisolibacter sp.]